MPFYNFKASLSRRLWWVLSFVLWLPASAQEWRLFPLGPIDGYYSVTANSSLAYVRSVDAGGTGALAGLQAGDYISGAFGRTFTPTAGAHYGVTQELGFAIDRAEAADGVLPLQIIRAGTGGMTLNVALPAAGAYGPAYPRNSPKYAAFYETAVAALHTRAMNSNGNLGYLTGFTGLCLIGHPDWNSSTGPKPYRLSINKIRDFAVSQINNWGYAATEYKLLDGTPTPNMSGGPSNWDLGSLMMFLSEYYAKSADSSVTAALQRGVEMCGNTVQWWKQPAENANGFSPEYAQVAGMSSHGGVTGDYMHQGWYCGINMNGVHNLNGMGFARRAGMDMNVRPKDGHYFGFNLNPGDPIPASIANALPASITLPQYAADPVLGSTINNPFYYDPSLKQKFLMQMNFICRRSLGGDGSIGYAPEAITNWDAGGRTPAALLAMAMYRDDVGGLDAADLNRLELMKSYITTNYMGQQVAHVYSIGGQVFQALATPYLNDRQQRFFMDNWRFYFALSHTSTNGVRYVSERGLDDAGAYLSNDHCGQIDAALPYGIANGYYATLPGYNTNRSLANFKSPALMWPSIAAHTCTVNTSTQPFQVDVCDGFGNVLALGSYTAAWSRVSGPATATFSSSNTANTTITLPTVSATPYRVRLTITRAGVPDLTEDIDITRANATSIVSAAIATHPTPQTVVPGGSASFTVAVSGTGPFVYQWRLNGVSYWTPSPSPTLSLTNIGSGAAGSYDCVITTPDGTLVSNPATLTINATPVRTSGGLRREIWTTTYGAAVSDLTSNSDYPLFPSLTSAVASAETSSYGDNYGQKLSGWIKPPISGPYKFFLASDDASQLWLSTDDTAANKVTIADHAGVTGFRNYSAGIQSVVVNLVAGQKYYIEILHKEGGGGDYMSVAWQMPGETAPANGSAPIDGVYLEYDQYQPLLTNHWKLDEASGTSCADSVGGITATLYNNPTRVVGISGNAVSFNGVNQYAMAPVDVSESVYAVSLWFRTSQAGGGLFCVSNAAGTNYDRNIWLIGGNLHARIWQNEEIASTGQNYADGQWHQVVHTYGGGIGGQKLYVDGEQVASGVKAQSDVTNQTQIRIGHSIQSPTPYFNGQIDDVHVYNAALSVSDAAAMYAAGTNAVPVMNAATFAVSESAAIGATVGIMSATDANAGQVITYSIVGGNVGNRFAIDPSTGEITLTAPLDFELSATHILTITATDNGTPAQSVTSTATINVSDVNEAPMFAANPLDGTPAAPGIAYTSSVSAVDPEGTAVTYTYIDGPAWLLIASDGTLTGTPAAGDIGLNSFTVRATDATSLSADVTLQIDVINVTISPVWITAAGGSWPVADNWLSGGIANGLAATANFSTLDLKANATVTLDGTRTIGGLKFGDTTPSHDWTLNPGSGSTLTLSSTSGSPVISVSNQTTTLNTLLAGNRGFVKTGAGTLILTQANSLTGTVKISQGSIRVSSNTSLGSGTITLGDANTGAIDLAWLFQGGGTPSKAVTVSNLGTGTVTLGTHSGPYASPSCPLTLNRPTTLNDSTGDRTSFSGKISGPVGTITLTGGRVTFDNGSNDFVGDVFVSNGTIYQNNAPGALPDASDVTLNGSARFRLNSNSETMGALNGSGSVDNVTGAGNTLTVGGGNSSGSFLGTLTNGSGALDFAKTGSGTQILGGANTYSGTTSVNGGTLIISGAIGDSGVTVASGATLAGSGTVTSPVTLNSGSTLAAGDASIGTLTLSNDSVSLHASGTVALRIAKSGGILSADRINLTGASGLTYKGTLTITVMASSDPLAAGDSFTLFSHSSGNLSGDFATINLPALPADLLWDTSRLTLDGIIEVKTLPLAETPVFSLASGTYVGPLSVEIPSATAGAVIHYTTDGSDPKISATAITAPSPASVSIPAPATVTLTAYASMTGFLDSDTASASYEALTTGTFVWQNPAGGSWPVNANWLGSSAANGTDVTARFDTLNLTADTAVTLDGAPTVGGLKFGDTTPSHNWTLNPGSGGPLTFAVTAGMPTIAVNDGTTTVNAVRASTQGLRKTGAGTLNLIADNTYNGGTVISRGTLALSQPTTTGIVAGTGLITLGDAETGSAEVRLAQQGAVSWPNGPDRFCANDIAVAAGPTGRLVLVRPASGNYAATFRGTIALANNVVFRNEGGDRLAIEGKITGTGNIALESVGGARINWDHPANDFLGNVTVTAGTWFQINNNNVIPATSDVNNHGTMSFQSGSATALSIAGLNGSGTFDIPWGSGNPMLSVGSQNHGGSFSGKITSRIAVVKTGTGTQILSGVNTYTGSTTVAGGVLLVNGNLAGSATTVAAPATLGGTGSIAGTVTNNGTISPGSNGVGNLTVNNTLTLTGGSAIAWEIGDWTGTAGSGFDKITATALNLTATGANRITIKPAELALQNFTETDATFILIQTTSGITGFSADKFTVDLSGLTLPQGTWAIQQSGNNLLLAYTAQTNPDANGNGILDTWETTRFGNADLGANLPHDDADHDGLSNLLEYSLDSNPTTGNPTPIIYDTITLGDGTHLRITVPKNPAATNLTYIVETCGTLDDWSAADTTIESDTATELIVRDKVPQSAASRRFIRLRVTSMP